MSNEHAGKNVYDTSADSQRARLLARLKVGPVDTFTARHELNVAHPAGRVQELRAEGFPILTHRRELYDEQGRKHPLSQVYELYSDGPDGGKADYIKKTVNEYRELARRQLLDEFPGLRTEYDDKQLRRKQILPIMSN